MFSLTFLLNLLVFCSGRNYIKFTPERSQPQKPVWPEKYYITGVLSLPYAELNEPFVAWYDATEKKSRVDFYGGISKTVQRGDVGEFGAHFMVVPMSNEVVVNKISCFGLNGTSDAPVLPQQLLPDIENFTYTGDATYQGASVNVWEYRMTNDEKLNIYTLYVTGDAQRPVYYEMMGYNSLLGSHYDNYKLSYNLIAMEFGSEVFDSPMSGLQCSGFPGPGHEARIISNPMSEFIYPEDSRHLLPMYSDFKKQFNKDHGDKEKHTFKHNLRYINSINRKNLSFKLKINHFADFTAGELRRLRGRQTTQPSERKLKNLNLNAKPFVKTMKAKDIPKEMNWRLFGAVTPVKDQAVCGSCWSFGSTGTIEGALFLKTGRLVRLSQQNLMDCSWGFGNNGCDGGEEFRAYEYIMKHGGISSELSYGDYMAVDAFCHEKKTKVAAVIESYVNVTSGDMDALKMAIAQKGPIAVGIDAAHLAFVFYSHGVYFNPECGNKPENLDHAVLAVGYGVQNGQPYTLVKNSWSTHWGNDGYVLMSQVDNNCGVATDATYVVLK